MFNSITEAVFHYEKLQPQKLCLADDTSSVTYSEYGEKIRKYAGVFASCGIARGDTVVVEASQTIEYLAMELALQLIGAVFVPVEHNCAAEKIRSFADRADAKAVITVKEDEYSVPLVFTYASLLEKYQTSQQYMPEKLPLKSDISEILFSTGTTGKEKGIVITHGNNIALAENVMYGVEMEKDNVEMIPSPMNHSHGLRRYYANMYNGCTVVLLGSAMNVRLFFANIDKYGVNSMDLVPTALSVILKLSKDKFAEYADRIRYIQFGAAPMMEADSARICSLLPDTRLYNFYGSTESGCICIYNFNRPDSKKHCIGKPAHNAKIVIVDDNRSEIVSHKDNTGLLASYGGMNMSGYWKDEEETAKVLIDGAVYSNDVAYFDQDGDIILLGRKGDVINVGGNKVSPEEIENAVKKIEGVADCGVIPVADPMKGQVPKLFVEMSQGHSFDAAKIRNWIAANMEPYKVPAVIVEIDKIPRSYNGKLLRKELK
ncbi:MAG: acyl--CoA ligase [Ruminococcaceae bacterium]|nr:acyl--CoA ligase [Oscillospiraceae bacterium]